VLELVEEAWRSPVALLYAFALSGSGLAIGSEALYSRIAGRSLYSWRDTLANASMWLGHLSVNLVWAHVVFFVYTLAYNHAPLHLSVGGWHVGWALWWEWPLLLVLEDFCFYAFHRASHEFRLLWASHVNHHSSERYNLSVAFRQTWTPFFALLFWLPLPLLGFDPLMVLTMQALSLFYQSTLHTQLVPALGPLGWVLNTPRHHSVHHGSNPQYCNKNMGGVLIVWDRLFGTFAQEDEPVVYGIGEEHATGHNPLWIAFHEWVALARDVAKSGSLREALKHLFR
jgi:sterol desaturase/sphingolipid hydroxylase (fatty acid hydroxylase superfamily)